MKRFFQILILLALFVVKADAATLYVSVAGSGAANGADWSNTLAEGFTPVRGNTYYYADGSYASKTFSTALSGTSLIVLQKATVSDHGTSTGWSDTMGDGQATFAYPVSFYTGYWTMDGATGTNLTTCGFVVSPPTSCATSTQHYIVMGASSTALDNMTFAHVASLACPDDAEKIFFYFGTQVTANNFTARNVYSDGFQVTFFLWGVSNVLTEYVTITNSFSSSGHHGDQWDLRYGSSRSCRDVTIRYCTIADSVGTGCIIANDGGSDEIVCLGLNVYGNIFRNCSGGNGAIGTTTRSAYANVNVFNNTFSGGLTPWLSAAQGASSATIKNATTNIVATNNIIFNMSAAIGDNATTPIVHDYNLYVSATNVPSEANGVTTNANWFVDSAAYNFRLATNTPAGATLASTFNTDPDGTTRTTWSRGAYEYVNDGNSWYVDKDATGSNNGTSWANAWTNFSGVTWGGGGVAAGDTLYISGGSTSKTYAEQWTVGAAGTVGSPINIRVGQDTGHNGDVIFDFSASASFGTNHTGTIITMDQNHVHVNGFVGGTSRLHLRNFYNWANKETAIGFTAGSKVGNWIVGVTATNINNFALFNYCSNHVIANNTVRGVRGDYFVRAIVTSGPFGSHQICSNSVLIWYNTNQPPYGWDGYAYSGPDAIQPGTGTSIFANNFEVQTTTNYTSSQHPDMVQCNGDNILIYGNDFQNVGDSCVDFDCWGTGYIRNLRIFNNTMRITSAVDPYPEFIRLYSTSAALTTFSNVLIANNTFAGNTAWSPVKIQLFASGNPTATGCLIVNNIWYDCANGSSFPMVTINSSTGFTASDWHIETNVFYNASSPQYLSIEGATTATTTWVAANGGSTSLPTFTDAAGGDFTLASGDSVARDRGADLSAYFTTDKNGNTRSGTWDLGAFEYGASGGGGDVTAPTCAITSPASVSSGGSGSYSTSSSTITVSGTSDDATATVTWSNSRGGAGTATGSASWSQSGITLASGGNVLAFTATDPSANATTTTLNVTYTAPSSGGGSTNNVGTLYIR